MEWIGADNFWKKWVGEGMGSKKYIPIGVGLDWGPGYETPIGMGWVGMETDGQRMKTYGQNC